MICFILISLFCLYYILLYLQEYHYHFNGFIGIIKKGLKDYRSYILLSSLIGIFIDAYSYLIYVIILAYIFFVILILEDRLVLKLKFTKRIIRNICLNLLIYALIIIFLSEYIYLLPLLVLFISFISYLLLVPIEKAICNYYIKKAKRKIKRIKPLIICITGSAGKTSSKHFLYHLIKDKYITFMTKGSYNTLMGIVRSINEEMNEFCEVAIFECGVSSEGDMSDILKVFDVDISIITTIFPQHLETFKSFDNLVKEKSLLANNVLLHIGNNKILNKLYSSNAKNVRSVGEDIIFNDKYLKDYLCFKYLDKSYKWKTKVVGRNNLENILYCLLVCLYLKLDFKYLEQRVRTLENVCNRLKIRYNKDKVIIDDSFNSNLNGFLDAINVASSFSGKRVIITPGIVSGGSEMESFNKEVALKIIKTFDMCFLVESISSCYFKELFDKQLYEYQNVLSFKEAYELANSDSSIKVILIENDITDIYKG